MSLTELSRTLWRQRELLQLLAFKLEEEHLLVAAGRARWLTLAAREVAVVRAGLQRLELRRAIDMDAVTSSLGLSADTGLCELAECVPAPWDTVLREHRKAFQCLADELLESATGDDIDAQSSATVGPLCLRCSRLQARKAEVTKPLATVASGGAEAEGTAPPGHIVELPVEADACGAAFRATASLVPPSLLGFLRCTGTAGPRSTTAGRALLHRRARNHEHGTHSDG